MGSLPRINSLCVSPGLWRSDLVFLFGSFFLSDHCLYCGQSDLSKMQRKKYHFIPLFTTFYGTPNVKHLFMAHMSLCVMFGKSLLKQKGVRPSNIREGNKNVDRSESTEMEKSSLTRKYRFEKDNVFLWFQAHFSSLYINSFRESQSFSFCLLNHAFSKLTLREELTNYSSCLHDVLHLGSSFLVWERLDLVNLSPFRLGLIKNCAPILADRQENESECWILRTYSRT